MLSCGCAFCRAMFRSAYALASPGAKNSLSFRSSGRSSGVNVLLTQSPSKLGLPSRVRGIFHVPAPPLEAALLFAAAGGVDWATSAVPADNDATTARTVNDLVIGYCSSTGLLAGRGDYRPKG